MIRMTTRVDVKGVTGQAVSDFMLNCTDRDYQRWWPGTHLAFHTLKRRPGHVGSLVYFDEYVGRRRLAFQGVVTELIPGKRLVWQMQKVIRLPGWLMLDFSDHAGGVTITHTLAVGWTGIGRVLDPILRIYLSPGFERELQMHARTEFPKLAELLS